MDIKFIRKIGNGYIGTVYLCMYNGDYAIAKMEKFDGDLSTKNNYSRQIEFNEFAKKHPDRFMVLLFSGIVNNCTFKQPTPKNIKEWPAKFRDKWLADQKNTKCSLLIYAPILSITLRDILKEITNYDEYGYSQKVSDILFEIFKHLKKSIELMNNAGFCHRDLHPGNIMYLDKTAKDKNAAMTRIKKLKIKPENFYIIDYGGVYHKNFEQNKFDKQINKDASQDIFRSIWCVCENPVGVYMDNNNIRLPKYKKSLRYLEQHAIYPELKKWLPDYVKRDMKIVNDMEFLHMICLFVNYDVYCESIEASEIQKKLNLIGFKPGHATYYLNIIKNLTFYNFKG